MLNKQGLFALLNIAPPQVAIDRDFTAPLGNVIPNQPQSVEIQIVTSSGAYGDNMDPSEAGFFNGTNGFSFPVGKDVFTLPLGYTVNVPEWNIVNNRWQPPAGPGDVSFVGTNMTSITCPGG